MRSVMIIVIISILSICATSHSEEANSDSIVTTDNRPSTITDGMTIKTVDITPKEWRDTVVAIFTVVLAAFTGALVWATIVYVRRTGENVKVSRDLLDSNKELIELNKAQNDIIKAQLLGQVDIIISNRRLSEGFPIDHDVGPAIRAYLDRAAKKLLGECYKKVMVKLKDDYGGTKPLFHIPTCQPGEPVVIPLIVWERLKELGEDSDFEFIEYVDTQ